MRLSAATSSLMAGGPGLKIEDGTAADSFVAEIVVEAELEATLMAL